MNSKESPSRRMSWAYGTKGSPTGANIEKLLEFKFK